MTKSDFVTNVIPRIAYIAKQRGYKYPSAIIAQAICESAWGTSSLSSKYYNFFGMKCGSSWKGKSVNLKTKEEYKVGTLTDITACFRAYDSIDDGINGYFDFIQKTRYLNLKDATSPEDYIQKLKADGWATSSTYVNTLTNILNVNDLKRYDNGKDRGDVITAIRHLQEELNKYGNYGLAVDGIIGPKTMTAYQKFRSGV